MKAKVITGIGIVALLIALFFTLKPKSFSKELNRVMENMDSYIMQGNMEVNKGEEVKSYALEVGYENKGKGLFKVALTDKEINQEQIIIRNEKGVYVITPSLNQVFKFEGDWPMNSPKPYLLQTIVDIVNQKETDIKKQEDGYLIHAKVTYPNNKNFDHEEIMFDKKNNLKWLNIFNKDNETEVKIVFSKVQYNVNLKKDYFKVPTELEKKVSKTRIQEEDLPLYPMQVFSSELQSVNKVESKGETKHILEYSGNKNFTIVETKKQSAKETQTVIMPGEMIDTLDVIGFYDGNHVSVLEENVEFSVFSDELSLEEMMMVIHSMQVAVMK